MNTTPQITQSFQQPLVPPSSGASLAGGQSTGQPEPMDAKLAFRRVALYESPWEAARDRSPEELQLAFSEECRATLGAIETFVTRFLEQQGPLDRRLSGLKETAPSIRLHGLGGPLNGLEGVYVLDDRARVAQFIEQRRLRNLLLQARGPLTDAFGEAAIKRLSVVEDDEGSRTLLCLVAVPGGINEARRALRSFDQRWWLAHCGNAAGKLNFDFDLV